MEIAVAFSAIFLKNIRRERVCVILARDVKDNKRNDEPFLGGPKVFLNK